MSIVLSSLSFLNTDDFYFFLKRSNFSEEKENLKQKVISMYRDFLNILKSDDFTEDLQSELQRSYPNYLTVLEKRITDMDKLDHGIVIAG